MFCISCIGSGVVRGLGENRNVCSTCQGLGRIIFSKKDYQGMVEINKAGVQQIHNRTQVKN